MSDLTQAELLESANRAFLAGDYVAAKAVLERVRSMAPDQFAVLSSLGAVCYKLNDFAAAKEHFRRASELDPKNVSVLVQLAHACLKLEQLDVFEDALGKALDLDPTSRDALKLLADLNLQNNRFHDAARTYTEILRTRPDDIECLLALGVSFFKLEDFETAKLAFERVLEFDPKNQLAFENLEVIRSRGSAGEPVRQDVGGSVGGASGERGELSSAFNVRPATAETTDYGRRTTDKQLVEDAQAAYADGNFGIARDLLLKAKNLNPTNVHILVQLALVYLRLEKVSEFEEALGKALELEPNNPEALKVLADLNFQTGRFKDAAQSYINLLKVVSNDVDSMLQLGECFSKLDDIETARSVFEQVLELEPSHPIASEKLRELRGGSSQWPVLPEVKSSWVGADVGNVQRPLKPTADHGPRTTDKRLIEEANAAYSQGDYVTARNLLVQAQELNPKSVPSLVQLALVHLKLNEFEQFESCLGRALELEPGNREALKVLSDLNFQNGNLKDAAQGYINILKSKPDDVEVMLALGVCFFRLDDLETARGVFEEVLKHQPGNETAQENLQLIRSRAGGGGAPVSRSASESVSQYGGMAESSGSGGSQVPEAATDHGPQDHGPQDHGTTDKIQQLIDQANFFSELGNREAAIESLEEAQDIRPRDFQLLTVLGSLYFANEDFEKAREKFRKAIEIRPRDADAYTRLAMASLKVGRVEEFESALGLALEIDPDHREALRFLAKTNLDAGRVKDAGKIYARLIEKKADDIESLLALALCFYKGGEFDSARMVYERILEADPHNATARENLLQLDIEKGSTPVEPSEQEKQKIKKWLDAAEDMFGSQNLAGARDALKSALDLMPASADILAALGSLCFQLGEMVEARDYLQRLVRAVPADPEKWVKLALTHYQLNEIPEFERALGRALELDPNHLDALRLLAHLNFNHGSLTDAAQAYGKILKQTPNDLEVLLALGVCFYKTGDNDAAQMMFERVLEIDRDNPIAKENLSALVGDEAVRPSADTSVGGTSDEKEATRKTQEQLEKLFASAKNLANEGNVQAAREELRRVLKVTPDDDQVWATVGSYSFQLGEYETSRGELERAIQLKPDSADYRTRLAMAALKLDRLDEFESALGRALELDGNYAPALWLLADLNFTNGRYEDAARTYNRLLRQNPDNIEVMLPLGACFYKVGDQPAAKMVFKRVLELDPQNEIARQNLDWIEQTEDPDRPQRSPLSGPGGEGGVSTQKSDVRGQKSEVGVGDFDSDEGRPRSDEVETDAPTHRPTDAPIRRLTVTWEGSQFVHHSLALINRELCLQLIEAGHHLSVLPYEPDQFGPDADPRFAKLAKAVRSSLPRVADIHVRHQWPLNFQPPKDGRWVVIQPWEFGSVPKEWVVLMQDYVDELWVPSQFVRKCFVNSGVSESKVVVIPNGINPDQFRPNVEPLELRTSKVFKFLFVGGTIGRKGIDVLLNTYVSSFSSKDDVCLVIKDMGSKSFYKGQTLESAVRKIQSNPQAPEILYRSDDMAPDELPSLYRACDCLVHPYRGEGFGLPVLEAMACGLPVIVTAGGATDDFATDEFALRIPAVRKSIGTKVDQYELAGEGWLLEPDPVALADRMREVVRDPAKARAMGARASEHVRRHWTWAASAAKAQERLLALAERSEPPERERRQSATGVPKLEVPPAGRLGSLQKVHDLIARKKYLKAWNAALEAIALRPFHPDAYLQMVDIALAAGDERQALVCAQRLIELTPNWDMAKRVHQSLANEKGHRKSKVKWTPLPIPPKKPRVSVCLIAKNEEEFIGRCLASVKPIAHQIVVVDTGSTDRTVEIAKQHGAEVHHFKWNDNFADARNAAHEHARGDWVLILDCDEELPGESHEKLWRDLSDPTVLGYRIPITNLHESNNSVTFVPRLFRNAPALFFVGRVHEQIYASVVARKNDWGMEAKLGTAMIVHHGYDPGLVKRRQKVKRNLALMERAIAEMPNESALLMNYGLDLVNDGRLEDGLEQYRKAFSVMASHRSESVLPEVRERLITLFGVHLVKAGRFEELMEVMNSKLAADTGPTASVHFLSALGRMKLNQYEAAIPHLRQCIAKIDVPTLTPPCHELAGAAPFHLIAECLAKAGQLSEAEVNYKTALEREPKSASVIHDYAYLLHQSGRSLEALKLLQSALDRGISEERIWHLGSFISNSKPEFSDFALDWTEEAMKFCPNHRAIQWIRSEVLLKSGRMQEALPLLENSDRRDDPAVRAAIILARLVANAEVPNTIADESKVSREFVAWYRRLLLSQQKGVVDQINSQLSRLRTILPTAASVIAQAMNEAS